MNIKRTIARWLGYGGMEWPRSPILDLPIKLIPLNALQDDGNFISVDKYPGGIQVLPSEAGTDGKFRYVWKVDV